MRYRSWSRMFYLQFLLIAANYRVVLRRLNARNTPAASLARPSHIDAEAITLSLNFTPRSQARSVRFLCKYVKGY